MSRWSVARKGSWPDLKFVAVGIVSVLVILCLIYSTRLQHEKKEQETLLPVVVIPGGGLTADGSIPDYVMSRMDKAIQLFELTKDKPSSCGLGPCLITLSAGTPHVAPPRDDQGFPLFDASVGAQYLIKRGIPVGNILEEKTSLDTLGNAYFLRTIHTDPNDWLKLVIITNHWHMPRVKAIFSAIFSPPPPCHNTRGCLPYDLKFEAVDDVLTPSVLYLREKREKKSLDHFSSHTAPLIRTLSDAHKFLFRSHDAYSATRLTNDHVAESIDPELLKSY